MAASPRMRNTLTLFSSTDDVLCHRVRLVLAAKGVSYDLVPVDPQNPPEDLIDLNPYHSVPTLVERDLVLYDAGVDIHQQDELGLLNISTPALYQRDLTVLQSCTERNIPVAAVIGGGYQRNVAALVQLHLQLFKAAFTLYGSDLAGKIET